MNLVRKEVCGYFIGYNNQFFTDKNIGGDIMFRTISNFMRVAEIRRKILFTLAMLIVFRIGTFIPVPHTNAEVLKVQDQANVLGMLNVFGGGALQHFSIFAVGITPYITASIIVQLLQMDVIPKFSEWAKQGEMAVRNQLNSLDTLQSFSHSYKAHRNVLWL